MKEEDFEGVDLVIRWGCTSNVPVKKVLNRAEAIHRVSDKSGFRKLLWEKEDNRKIIPLTFFDDEEEQAICDIENGLQLLVRPKVHAQGKNAFLVKTPGEFEGATEKCGQGWYASEFIPKVAEYRVFVACGKVVWVASKTPANPDAIVWNVAQGGKFDNVSWGEWNLSVCDAAIRVMRESGLDFGGVDVMVDKDGGVFVIEINSAPSQTSPYRQQCVAKAFDYIIQKGKDWITSETTFENWRDCIHPAIWSKGAAQ